MSAATSALSTFAATTLSSAMATTDTSMILSSSSTTNASSRSPRKSISWSGSAQLTSTITYTAGGVETTSTSLYFDSSTFEVVNSLLTIYTPAAACTGGPWTSISSNQGVITCTQALPASCYPAQFASTQSAAVFSPGVCPSGWKPGFSWPLTENATTSVTAIASICCPSGMTYLHSPLGTCASLITGSTATVVISKDTVTYAMPLTAFAPTIAVLWAEPDLTSFTPASAPLLEAALATQTGDGTDQTNGTTSASSASVTNSGIASNLSGVPTSGRSAAAKAGIGVGVAVAILMLLAAGVWLVWRRRRTGKRPPLDIAADGVFAKAELPGREAEKRLAELGPGEVVAEVDGGEKPAEVTLDVRYELDSGWQGHEASDMRSPK